MGFRSQFGSVAKLAERWAGTADTYMVYVREAFPSESRWPAPVPDEVPVNDPKTRQERLQLVGRFIEHVVRAAGVQRLSILVDSMEDTAVKSYDAYPYRVYLIDRQGEIAVTSEKGVQGFQGTMLRIEQWLQDDRLP